MLDFQVRSEVALTVTNTRHHEKLLGFAKAYLGIRETRKGTDLLTTIVSSEASRIIRMDANRLLAIEAMKANKLDSSIGYYEAGLNIGLAGHIAPNEAFRLLSMSQELSALYERAHSPDKAIDTRARVVKAIRDSGNTRVLDDPELKQRMAVSQVAAARQMRALGQSKQAITAYEDLFRDFPEFTSLPLQAVSLRWEWIELHGYSEKSEEYQRLLESIYENPGLKHTPQIGVIGVHLGRIYQTSRNPIAESHFRSLVESFEEFRATVPKKDWDANLLINGYEIALGGYARALRAKGDEAGAKLILAKLNQNYANSAGGKFAKHHLGEIRTQERRSYSKTIAVAFGTAAVAAIVLLYKVLLPKMQQKSR